MNQYSRRLAKLLAQWSNFLRDHDRAEAAALLAGGASTAIPWEQWPPPLLDFLRKHDRDPAATQEALRQVELQDATVIRIQWVDTSIVPEPMPTYAPAGRPQAPARTNLPDPTQDAVQAQESPAEPAYSFERAKREFRDAQPRRARPGWKVR
jgi:hypothetical protein